MDDAGQGREQKKNLALPDGGCHRPTVLILAGGRVSFLKILKDMVPRRGLGTIML